MKTEELIVKLAYSSGPWTPLAPVPVRVAPEVPAVRQFVLELRHVLVAEGLDRRHACIRVRDTVEPNPDWALRYADGYARYRALYPAIRRAEEQA